MASELIEMAREVGGDELAERVKRLEDEVEEVEELVKGEMKEDAELKKLLKQDSDLSDSAIEGMNIQAKRAVAEATGLREETTNVRIPVAGRYSEEPTEDEEVTINRSSPDTYTEEVPIPAPMQDPDDADTISVEYANQGPSIEALNEFHSWLNQARSEATRRQQERANERREKQMSGAVPNYEYLNGEDGEADDSEIPAPGEIQREADDE